MNKIVYCLHCNKQIFSDKGIFLDQCKIFCSTFCYLTYNGLEKAKRETDQILEKLRNQK